MDSRTGSPVYRYMAQAMAAATNFAVVERLLILVGLGVQFEAVSRSSVKDSNVGKLNRDKSKHSYECQDIFHAIQYCQSLLTFRSLVYHAFRSFVYYAS